MKRERYLLDTCILVWLLQGNKRVTKALNEVLAPEERGFQKNFNIYQNQNKITFNSHFCDARKEYQLKFMIIDRETAAND